MTTYQCERCHSVFDKACNLERHLRKINSCQCLYSKKSREELISNLQRIREENKPEVCPHCNKHFSTKITLNRHITTQHDSSSAPCTSNVTNTSNSSDNIGDISNADTTHTVAQVINESQIETLSNQITDNSINVTIHINPFGQERLDYILSDKEFLTKCLKSRLHNSIPEMFSKIYLNKDVPENQNIKYHRMHPPRQVKVFTSDDEGETQWLIETANPIIDTIIEKCVDILIQHNEEIRNPLVVPRTVQEHDRQDTEVNRVCNLVKTKAKTRGHHAPVRDKIFGNLVNEKQQQEPASESV